jgi:hypothetical protein
VLFHGLRRQAFAEPLDLGRRVHRLEIDEFGKAVGHTPAGEPRHRPDMRLAGVGTADPRRIELQEPPGRVGPGREPRR